MLFKEYDSAAHIASEKEISYEEGVQKGRLIEQEMTQREKKRADKLLNALVFAYHDQGKSIEEIAALCEVAKSDVENMLGK